MPWVKMDDGYPEHPKVDRVGAHAAWLNVCAWAYCARNLTDGFVPAERVVRLATVPNANKLAAKLVEANLWEAVEGGFKVHDYLVYNPSREQVLAERAAVAKRVADHRARGNGVTPPDGNGVTNRVTTGVTNGVSTDAPYPVPPPTRTKEDEDPPVVPPAAAGGTAQAEAVPRRKGRRGRTKGEHSRITEAEIEALVEKFTPLFGSERVVRLAIDKALNSAARATWLDEVQGVNNWLRGDLERLRERGKVPPEPVEALPVHDEPREPEAPFVCPGCDCTEGKSHSTNGLCFGCHHAVAWWRKQHRDEVLRGEIESVTLERDWIAKARELHEAAVAA